ncbi:MAG TPA: tRNA epoxyqueuosine(34) reductase QueG [Thermoanaerobaculia bacterium]|nr:tRNA epoxyqueuosine(34) reductase QueG [Thermoanaerobaculia bacterium]
MTGRSDRVVAARIFREEAAREGFSRVGIARAQTPPRFDLFSEWISAGQHAGMAYLERTAGVRSDPGRLLAGVRSIVCLASPHRTRPITAPDGSVIARYADGPDYHGTLRSRAIRVALAASERIGGEVRWRVCVDSTPLAERSFAAAAGVGWIGKNGCLIDRELGSYLLLAEILTDADVSADEPVAELCGSCVRCLESCPTDAFVAPGLLDAHRCLSYWTIEHRGAIPDDVKPALAGHVFGCDVCQEVCPWNEPPRRSPALPSLGGGDRSEGTPSPPTRAQWLAMGRGEWRRRFGATALNRAGRRGLQRNAAISAAATSDPSVLPLLPRAERSRDRGLSDAARWAAARLPAEIERTP